MNNTNFFNKVINYFYAVLRVYINTLNHAGEYNEEATPVNIPNTEVKLFSAKSTSLETDWEDRSSPAPF